jgi:hypothetical protein
MGSRWLPGDGRTVLVITTHCGRGEHDKCAGTWPGGECGCTCHLSNMTDVPDGR